MTEQAKYECPHHPGHHITVSTFNGQTVDNCPKREMKDKIGVAVNPSTVAYVLLLLSLLFVMLFW